MTHSKDEVDVLTQAAEEIARVNLKLAELTEYKAELLSVFKNPETNLPPRKEPYQFGKVDVKVSESGRIDDGLARTKLPVTVYRKIVKQTVDTSLARKVLTDEQIKLITKKFDNKIEIKLR